MIGTEGPFALGEVSASPFLFARELSDGYSVTKRAELFIGTSDSDFPTYRHKRCR
jgi:hypothetical protein